MLWVIVVYLLAVNVLGGVLFTHDKRAAEADRRRVPERVLLGVAALGASPAMLWLAAKIRHKTRKQPFRGILIAIGALQLVAAIAALAWRLGIL